MAMLLAWFLFSIEEGKEYVLKIPFNRLECEFSKDFHQRYIPWNWYECINLGLGITKEEETYRALQGLIADGVQDAKGGREGSK
jgi:hypothetical protein